MNKEFKVKKVVLSKIIFAIFKKCVKIFYGHGLSKVYPVNKILFNIYDIIMTNFHDDFVEVDGQKMFLDAKDSLQLTIFGIYEPLETNIFKNKIREGDVVVDIGANIGYYSLIAAKIVGKKGLVFAFEPDPDNFALLEKNIKINKYKNIVAVRKAVSNKTGNIRLYHNSKNLADHRIYDSYDKRDSVEIKVVRLDDYFKDFKRKINLIKMDIEGSELGAIQGMKSVLKRNGKVLIITEFWPSGIKRFGADPECYPKYMIRNGFKLFHINEDENIVKSISVDKLLNIYTIENENHTNLLWTKSD